MVDTPGLSLLAPLASSLRGVPSGPIEYEDDAFSLSRSHFFSEFLQSQVREHLGANGGQDEPVDLPLLGWAKA